MSDENRSSLPPPPGGRSGLRARWRGKSGRGVLLIANIWRGCPPPALQLQGVPPPRTGEAKALARNILLVAAIAFATPPAHAQSVPDGPYMGSCRDIYVDRTGALIAECRDRSGEWRQSILPDAGECRGEIVNDDGDLVCEATRRDPERAPEARGDLPPGPWARSCRNIEVSGDFLVADCRTDDGRWRESAIDWRSCGGSIAVDDGRLYCDADYSRDSFPQGTWASTCRDFAYEAGWLYAECRRRDGTWRDAQIFADDCGTTISNVDGRLVCDTELFSPRTPAEITGNFRDTCRNVKVEDGVIAAECRRTNGGWRYTELELSECPSGNAANVDGRLTCQ